MRKFLSLCLALALVFCLAAPALAEEALAEAPLAGEALLAGEAAEAAPPVLQEADKALAGTPKTADGPIEVWKNYLTSNTVRPEDKVGAYASLKEAFAAVTQSAEASKLVYIRQDYTLEEDLEIPTGVRLIVYGNGNKPGEQGATLTIPSGRTLTVKTDCNRFDVLDNSTLDIEEGGKVFLQERTLEPGEPQKGTVYIGNNAVLRGDFSLPENMRLYRSRGTSYYAMKESYTPDEIVTDAQGKQYACEKLSWVGLSSGETLTLLKDVTGNLTVSGDDITIDLGGHAWTTGGTTSPAAKLNGTGIVVKNGTLQAQAGSKCPVDLDTGAEVTIAADAAIKGAHTYGVLMGSRSALTVEGTITSTDSYAITGNGDGNYDNTLIHIKDGATVTSSSTTAIYHPQVGVLNVSGGTISGATGIEMRSGTLNMSGGTVTGQGTFAQTINKGGPTTMGVGIAAVQHVTRNDLQVNITGGVVQGTQNAVRQNEVYDDPHNNVHVSITNGTFAATGTAPDAAAVFSGDNVQNFISGGTFSGGVEPSYCAPGCELKDNGDGTYTAITPPAPDTTIRDTAIALDKTELSLEPGQTAKLKASLTPADATYKYIFWESSDEAVATVSDSGLVTAVADGTATITAKSWYGNTATCAVTVKTPDEPTPPQPVDPWPTEGLAGFVTRCYRVALSRDPDKAGHADWVRWLKDGTVDATSCTYGFVFSKETNNKNLSDEAFVKTLYNLFMDREGEATGVAFWTEYLQAGHSRLEVFHGFADSVEFARIKTSYGLG